MEEYSHMRRTGKLAAGVVALAGLTLAACTGQSPEGIVVGVDAPDFTLSDAYGNEVALEDYTGEQPVLLFFHMAVG